MSNGAEHLPERATDYKALIEEAERFVDVRGFRRDTDLVHRLADALEALVAENEKLRAVARASVRRLEKAAQYCGDPQHPIWDGGRISDKARERVQRLVDILDPFRPELEDASDEDWDRIYKLDPIDAYVSDYEERMEARAIDAEAQRDVLRAQLDSLAEVAVPEDDPSAMQQEADYWKWHNEQEVSAHE